MTGNEILCEVVRELGTFQDRMVFTGGLVLPLYFERPPAVRLRTTVDADAVVACTSHAQWMGLQAALMASGIKPLAEPGAPICRMRTPGGHLIDVMPIDPGVLGFGNRWFREGFERAVAVDLGGTSIRLFPPTVYLAAKAEAFRGRGAADPWLSHDLEDIFTLIDCRPSLQNEVKGEKDPLLGYLKTFIDEILAFDRLEELLEGHLPGRGDHLVAALRHLSDVLGA